MFIYSDNVQSIAVRHVEAHGACVSHRTHNVLRIVRGFVPTGNILKGEWKGVRFRHEGGSSPP